MRCLFPVLLAASCAFGWEYEYATNRDGSVFYFSSSLRMKGTAQYFHPKIFVWEAGKGVRLYEQRASDVPARIPAQGWVGDKYFSLAGVDVSSDGSTVAVIGVRSCSPTSTTNCSNIEPFQSTIYVSGKPGITMPGAAVLSRNGRYAAPAGHVGNSSDPLYPVTAQLIDLQAGQPTQISGWRLEGFQGRRVADNGAVLLQTYPGWVLARGAQVTRLDSPPGPLYGGWVNAAATLVVYWTTEQVFAYSVATRDFTLLSAEPSRRVAMSDDGSIVAFDTITPLSGLYGVHEVHVVRSDGTGKRRLTNFPEGASPVAMSGDGKFVFATTGITTSRINRIVRIDVESGQWTEIVPPMPGPLWVNFSFGAGTMQVSPGALTAFDASGIVQEATEVQPPLPSSLSGTEVLIGGRPVPIAAVTPGAVRFQVPWDLPQGYTEMEVHGPNLSTSLFVAGAMLAPREPGFFWRMDDRSFGNRVIPAGIMTAAHEDFSSLVSYSAPARPGEVIHIYAQGLGPASPLPALGEAASAQPLSTLTAPLTCVFSPLIPGAAGSAAEILFAGLAPGMMGIYQIDVRMPASFQGVGGGLNCRIGDTVDGTLLNGGVPLPTTGN